VRSRVRNWLGGAAVALALLVALLSWAFASPVGSAPDDDSHLANIYCIHDSTTCRSQQWDWPWWPPWWHPDPADRKGPEYAGAKKVFRDLWAYPEPRELPCYVRNGTNWYGPDVTVAATCLNDEDPAANQPASVERLGYYPNLYYRFLSLFTGDTIRQSVATWRVVNVLTATALICAAVLLSAPRYRRAVTVGGLVAAMPLGLFLASSINPSSWVVIAGAAFLGPAVSALRDRGSPRLLAARLAFLAICLVMLIAGRSEGPGIAALLVVVALVLGLKAPRAVYAVLAGGTAFAGIVALIFLARSDTTKVKVNMQWLADGLTAPGQWDALMAVPGFFFGAEAYKLGWLDLVPPPAAVVATNAAFWGAFILGLAVMFGRKAAALALVAGVLLVVPTLMIAGGNPAQPTRYFLPVVFMLAFVVLVPPWNARLPRWATAQWVVLWAALSGANSLSLLYLTVRHVSGINPGTTNPRTLAATPTPEWWWGAWPGPFANWLLGSIAFTVAVGLLFWLLRDWEGREETGAEAPPAAAEPTPAPAGPVVTDQVSAGGVQPVSPVRVEPPQAT